MAKIKQPFNVTIEGVPMSKINVIGGGLAGSECALYLANHGYKVDLYDIKGEQMTPAHHNKNFAEIVCSNSLKSDDDTTAAGVFKIIIRSKPRDKRMVFITPFLFNNNFHARIRSKKFIHIGSMKINTTRLWFLIFKLFKIIAKG